jgi:RNA polymerase sigma factor (sigma-70 family)
LPTARRKTRRLTPERAKLAEMYADIGARAAVAVCRRKGVPVHRWPELDWDDIRQVGREGVCIAADKWNTPAGDFGGFAFQRAYWHTIDWLRKEGPWTRSGNPRRHREIPWVSDGDYPDDNYAPTEFLMREEEHSPYLDDLYAGREFVEYCCSLLTEREAHVVRQSMVHRRTLESIGRELGVSESRVSQIMGAAVNKMRRDQGVIDALFGPE